MAMLTGVENTFGSRAVNAPWFSPEFAAILECARGEVFPRRSAPVLLETSGLDWNSVWNLAQHHSITSLLYPQLARYPSVPEALRLRFSESARRTALQTAYLTAQLVKIQGVLQTAGIRAIAYKGPALSTLLYGERALREFSDLDLLIQPEQFFLVKRALRSAGFVPEHDLGHWMPRYLSTGTAYEFWSPQRNYHLEIHWKGRSHPSFSRNFDPDWLWSDTRFLKLGNTAVETLSAPNVFLLLSMHAVKHGWAQLSWLIELTKLAQGLDASGWNTLWSRASAAQSESIVAVAVALSNRLLEAGLPTRAGTKAEQIAAKLARNMASGKSATAMLQVQLRDGLEGRYRLLRYLTVNPNIGDYTQYPLPLGLGFLFPAVRIYRLLRDHVFSPKQTR